MKILMKALCVAAMLAFGAMPAVAQLTKDQMKERSELRKATKKELNEKATKAARKEAKKLEKEGWTVAPGALPIEKQLDRSFLMQMEYDDELQPKYLMAEAMSVGGNYDAAKMQALELAKQGLAGQIRSELAALVESSVRNEQLSGEQAATVTRTISESSNRIMQSLGRTMTVVELYRTLPNKNKEVLVRIACNADVAKEEAKKAVYDSMEDQSAELRQRLNAILSEEK